MSVFAITILLTGTITPALLIQEADAIKSQGTFRSQINSNAVCGDTLCSAGINPSSPTGVTIQSDQRTTDVELLFVQSSTSGTFDDGEKTLTLVGISPATVYFSDRPNRVTGFEDTESFVAMWSEGEDSFASDPPNAVLEMHGSDGQSDIFIIELMNPIYDSKDKTLQYTIKILAEASDGLTQYDDRNDLEIPATFEDAVLFIDGSKFGKWMKDTFIDEPQQGDERPATILPDVPTPWHAISKAGDAVGEVTQHEYNKILQSIDVGDWEEHAVKYSMKMRMLSAHAGANLGEKIGGERGKEIGASAGAAIGQAMAATITKTLTSGKIGNNSVIDNMDVANLSANLQKIASSTVNNFLIAYTLSDNIIEAKGQNISDTLLKNMQLLAQTAAQNAILSGAYDTDDFCGADRDEFIENTFSKIMLFYLKYTLEFWILNDLDNGMTYDEIQADIRANIEDQVKLVIVQTLWELKDYCLSDTNNDLYALIFNQLFVADTTPIPPSPAVETAGNGIKWEGSAEVYPGQYKNYPQLETKPTGDADILVAPQWADPLDDYYVNLGKSNPDLFTSHLRQLPEDAPLGDVPPGPAINDAPTRQPVESDFWYDPYQDNLLDSNAADIGKDVTDGLDAGFTDIPADMARALESGEVYIAPEFRYQLAEDIAESIPEEFAVVE